MSRLPDPTPPPEEPAPDDRPRTALEREFQRAVRAQQITNTRCRAVGIYRGILRKEPEHYGSLLNLGVLRFEDGHVEDSVQLFTRALATRAGDLAAQFNLGKALRALGDRRAAQRYLELAYEQVPGDVDVLEELGGIYLETDRLAAAEALARHAGEVRTDHPRPWVLLARACLSRGRFEDAAEILDGVIERFPDSHEAFSVLAEVRFHQGDLDRSLLLMKRALLIQPEVGAYHRQLGIYQSSSGDHAAARLSFGKARDLSPELPVPPDPEDEEREDPAWERLRLQASLLERARSYSVARNWKAGIAEFLALTAKHPREAVVWQELGGFYEHLGEPRRALTLYRKAVDLDPGNVEVQLRVVHLELELGRVERAGEVLEALDGSLADVPEVLEAWGRFHLANRDHRRARRFFERCLDRMPNGVTALRGVGACYRAAGDAERAVAVWTRAFRAFPGDADLALDLAELLEEQDLGEEAEKVLRAAAERNPERPLIRARLARRLLGRRRFSGARKVYMQSVLAGPPRRAAESLEYLEALVYCRKLRDAQRVLRAVSRPRPKGEAGARLAFFQAVLAVLEKDPNRFSLAWQRAWKEDPGLDRHAPFLAGVLEGDDMDFLRAEVRRGALLFARDEERSAALERMGAQLFPAGLVRSVPGPA